MGDHPTRAAEPSTVAVSPSESHSRVETGPSIDDDWDRRTVCSNGDCVGVVGNNGRCNVCGLEVIAGGASPSPGDVAQMADLAPESTVAAPDPVPEGGEHDDPWSRRQLCSNGACLGIIGDTGRCSVCGTAP